MKDNGMNSRSLLIFDHDGARFAVDATLVRESVWLPELTPVEEAPPWIVGLFSLRGQIIPVADLHLRFDHPARRYSTGDHVVVLETDRLPLGLIVSEVREVIELPINAIQSPPQFDSAVPNSIHLVAGEARVGDELVTLLDVSRLAHLPEGTEIVEAAEQPALASYFCPEASPAERALFRKRAMALRETAADEEGSRLGLAVVELGGEYFGVGLSSVLEFCDIAELSPIPCCPPHILGAMSLRGELLTLIDPRSALNLPHAARGGKAVVALLGEQSVGIAVDQVHDVVYLRDEELQPAPAALREQCGISITGTAPYAGRTMTVLDLPALLTREEWIVNEQV
jgi:purine-binding chemotaxis protein CheW